MTAVMQLTDTDCAYPLKAAMSRAKDEMKRMMRTVAEKLNEVGRKTSISIDLLLKLS